MLMKTGLKTEKHGEIWHVYLLISDEVGSFQNQIIVYDLYEIPNPNPNPNPH